MSESYVYSSDGEAPQTREELGEGIKRLGHTIVKIELDLIKRERKRQAMANLLEKHPEKKFFTQVEIKREMTGLDGEDFDHGDW